MLAAKKHLDVTFAIYTFDETVDKLSGVHLHIRSNHQSAMRLPAQHCDCWQRKQ